MAKSRICTNCGSEDVNFAINIGLCDACIGERLEKLEDENEGLKEDVKRCGENWKAIYHELKIKLQRITEAWNTEIESKEDSVFVGELHYELPKQTPKGDKDES